MNQIDRFFCGMMLGLLIVMFALLGSAIDRLKRIEAMLNAAQIVKVEAAK